MTEKPKARKRPSKGGRPPYRPSIEDRQTVEQMKFVGESDNTIARALGIDPDTLRKHFADELADGHAQRRKEVIGLLFKSARDGNVSAQKKLEEMGRVAAADAAARNRGGSGQAGGVQATPVAPKGKKELQQAAAEAIAGGSSKFAPPAPPKLVVDNR